jgi:hypothetical protein
MARAKYCSPRLERGLISQLYHQAQVERVPMTALASRLVREGLASKDNEITSVVAKEPHAFDSLRTERTTGSPTRLS